jgi:small subunit ribosomal protein S6
MVFYETTYILHSALQEGRLNDIISVIENKIKSLGANIVYSDNWGRKKLAYMINKEKYGTYIFVQFSLKDSDKLKELSAEFEHNPNVLRYLNIRIEE